MLYVNKGICLFKKLKFVTINRRGNYNIDYKSAIYFSYNGGDLISNKSVYVFHDGSSAKGIS